MTSPIYVAILGLLTGDLTATAFVTKRPAVRNEFFTAVPRDA